VAAVMRRVVIGVAALVSAPGVLLAAAACLYIVWSIATESWYRQTFLAHGAILAALYAAFLVGVASAAHLAIRGARGQGRYVAFLLVALGIVAALAIELEVWDEAERLLPLGLLAAPFVAWAIAALCLRHLPAPLPAMASDWEDSRAGVRR